MSTSQHTLRLTNSFQHENQSNMTSKLDELLRLYKVPAMINDLQSFYFQYQIIAPQVNTTQPTYGLIGTRFNVTIPDISLTLSNSRGMESGKYMYEITLTEASISTDPKNYIDLTFKTIPQTLFLRFQNFGRNTSYQWAVVPNTNDKGHQVIHVFSDQLPPILNLELGHVTCTNDDVTTYYDFNSRIDIVERPALPLFFNQQANVITLRWLVRKIHIGF